jgi:lipopolysaccharide transport system permease protein
LNIIEYEPDNSIKKGYGLILHEIGREIWNNRWLTFQIFKRDFTASYKQSMMGAVWAFVIPLFSIATFVVLNRSGVFNIGNINVPYPLYAVSGMAFWQLFSAGLVASSQSLVLAGPMISKINFSKKSLVIAAMGQAVVAFAIQLGLLAVLFILYRQAPQPGVIWLPLVMLPVLLLTLGLGFVLSLINCVIKDVANILPMFLTFFMFLTPVLYEQPMYGLLKILNQYNPMYYFLSAARGMIFQGGIRELSGYIAATCASVAIFILGLLIFHMTETRITERV